MDRAIAMDVTDDEIVSLAIPTVAKVAGGIAMATGGFTLGLAAQTGLIYRTTPLAKAVIAAMVVAGIVHVVLGWGTFRARSSHAVLASVWSGIVMVASGAWMVRGFLSFVISPLSVWVVACAVASTITCVLAIGPSTRVSNARASLRARGLDFGA